MRNGTYRSKSIDFTQFDTDRFVPFLSVFHLYGALGCGPATLALLTGDDPIKVYDYFKLSDTKTHVGDSQMVEYLGKQGFKVVEVKKSDVTRSLAPIKNSHVVLFSQLVIKGEATWAVLYDGVIFHNFEMRYVKPLEFINRPLLTTYLVWHPKYKFDKKKKN